MAVPNGEDLATVRTRLLIPRWHGGSRMRKLFWQMNVTLNGFMEGPKQELDRTAQVEDEDYWPSATGADATG